MRIALYDTGVLRKTRLLFSKPYMATLRRGSRPRHPLAQDDQGPKPICTSALFDAVCHQHYGPQPSSPWAIRFCWALPFWSNEKACRYPMRLPDAWLAWLSYRSCKHFLGGIISSFCRAFRASGPRGAMCQGNEIRTQAYAIILCDLQTYYSEYQRLLARVYFPVQSCRRPYFSALLANDMRHSSVNELVSSIRFPRNVKPARKGKTDSVLYPCAARSLQSHKVFKAKSQHGVV